MVFNKLGHYVYKILHKKYCFITSIAFDESVFYCTNGSIFFLWIMDMYVLFETSFLSTNRESEGKRMK